MTFLGFFFLPVAAAVFNVNSWWAYQIYDDVEQTLKSRRRREARSLLPLSDSLSLSRSLFGFDSRGSNFRVSGTERFGGDTITILTSNSCSRSRRPPPFFSLFFSSSLFLCFCAPPLCQVAFLSCTDNSWQLSVRVRLRVCVCVRVYARVSTAAAKKTWILIALNHFGLDCRWFVNFNLFISPLLLISSSFNDIYVYMYIHIFSGISAATASVWVRLPVIPIVIDSMNSCTCESQDDEGGERRGKATAGERSMPTESGDLSFPRMIVP